ncbi:MAG: ABC transporter permease, partial [Runella slithyformis]
MKFLVLYLESFRFALGALRENLLRTTLSLLGVTVGIFSIIGVLTMVDALERSIKESLSFLGDKVIYVEKWPWIFQPGYPWWKYVKRPQPTLEEYEFLQRNLTKASAVGVFGIKGGLSIKYNTSSISDIYIQGITYHYNRISDIRVEKGRYFSQQEADNAYDVILLGYTIAKDLFDIENPVDKVVKIKGRKFRVVGVLSYQGQNLLGAPSTDNIGIIPFHTLGRMFEVGERGVSPSIAVKGFENDQKLEALEGEVVGLMRNYRGLRPIEEETFAINRPEMFATFLDGIIAVLTLAGAVIGSFSILVGGFGIANIMFVSVKERTNIIGIQKSLGARNSFILSEFLFEAILLSLIGGAFGLLLVYGLTFISTDTFVIVVGLDKLWVGVGLACVIGVVSGIIPAYTTSRLDPV